MGICFRFMNKSIVKNLDIFKQHEKNLMVGVLMMHL